MVQEEVFRIIVLLLSLLISTTSWLPDVASLDKIASQIMAEHDETFQPEEFQPTLDHAHKLKLGNVDLEFIHVVNVKI